MRGAERAPPIHALAMATHWIRKHLSPIQRQATPLAVDQEPPVVARFMVEIRSDGTRSIARGALDDVANGESAAIEARGSTPAMLAASLLKSLLATPLLGKVISRRRLGR
jgi:hypothetical protein